MPILKKIQAESISCVRQAQLVFSNLSFNLSAGELLMVQGPNGAGKSSLLRLLAGIATPNEGQIFWQGKNIANDRLNYWQQVHFISHANGTKLDLTVKENLRLFATINHQAFSDVAYHEILNNLNLAALENQFIKFLSAGQKRRVALAKLFLIPKLIWLLDEPMTGLDNQTETFFLQQLARHKQSGGLIVMSTHQTLPQALLTQQLSL